MKKILQKGGNLIKKQTLQTCRGKEEYESMIRKAITYLQTTEDNNKNPLQRSKSDDDFSMVDKTDYDPKDRMTFSVQQDAEVFEEQQKYIGDLERVRMQNIDEVLGTNTHFHETKPYEERIDTEHIMERSLIKKSSMAGKSLMEKFLEFDPQEKRPMPKFRSFQDFTKSIQQIKTYPSHEKRANYTKTNFNQIRDEYSYLKLDEKSLQLIKESHKQEQGVAMQNSEQLEQIQQFIMAENLYTDMSLLKGTQLEDKLLEEYNNRVEGIQQFPLYYQDYIYYTKNANQGVESHLNLYRVDSKPYNNKEFDLNQYQLQVIKNQELSQNNEQILDIVPEEQLIISKQEIEHFLENYEEDSRVSHLLENLVQNQVGYHNIIFDKKHEKVAIFLDVYNDEQEFILLLKDIKNGKMFPSLITEVADTVGFDDFDNFYFVRKNLEIQRASRVFKSKFISQQNEKEEELEQQVPEIIYEEKDPNFEIKINQSLSNEFIFLEVCQISGDKINEIYYKECFKADTQFKLLLGRDLKGFFEVKAGNDSFFYIQKNQNQQQKTEAQDQQNQNNSYKNLIQELGKGDKIVRVYYQQDRKDLIEQQENNNKDITINPNQANKNEIERTLKEISQDIQIKSFTNITNQLQLREKTEIIIQQGKNDIEQFYQCDEGEQVIDFEIFQFYAATLVRSVENKHFIKFYNFRNNQFHTLKFEEPMYKIEQERLQNYYQQYYQFSIKQPNQSNKIMNYNIAMRELTNLHTTQYAGFQSDKYQQEKIHFTTRDNQEIPAILVYQRDNISSESPIILKYETDMYTLEGQFELQAWDVSLLDRGFVICYPILRGSLENGEQHFNEGSNLKRLTNFCDLVDLANFIEEKEISNKILLYGKNLGAMTCLSAYLNAPDLFKGIVLENGIYDLADFMQDEKTQQLQSQEPYLSNFQKVINYKKKSQIFGEFKDDQEIQDFILGYCPYQLLSKSSNQNNNNNNPDKENQTQEEDLIQSNYLKEYIFKNVFICGSSDFAYIDHSRKIAARFRENDENEEVFYKEYKDSQQYDIELEMNSQQYAFLINSAFFKTASRNN